MDKGIFDIFSLEGRTAIVVGIGPGVGEHVAKAYARAGANVVCVARGAAKIEKCAQEIRDAGGKAIAVPADATKRDHLDRVVDETHKNFGPVHIVFNNAAAEDSVIRPPEAGIWANTPEMWDFNFALQCTGVFHLAKLTFPDMEKHQKGSIITVGSCGGFRPYLPSIAYGVAKAGLNHLTRCLAKALAPAARCNMICVGAISPDGEPLPQIVRAGHPGHSLAQRNAIKRMGRASEVVGAALLLASDASSYTTGSTIFTEGGRIGTLT
jgi:NAD(P)-dependent dehydrogenase (short-subunit alcohol dehydrogenase family)